MSEEEKKDSGVFMTASEASREIEMLKTVFDIVRLVDVSRTIPVEIGEDRGFHDSGHRCFAVWNKEGRCENCISAKVFAHKNRMTKFEFVNDEIYQVVSKYVVIDGNPLVMEMVFKMRDNIFLGAYGSGPLIEKISKLNRELYEDPLTGARNRRYFEEQLKSLGKMGALAMIDVDDFKKINDNYGHLAGDAALCTIVRTIFANVRPGDVVLRYGGDEFLLMFDEMPEEVFRRKLDKIREEITRAEVPEYEKIRLSVSIGGVCGKDCMVCHGVKEADRLLYEAKSEKNCVVFSRIGSQ